MVSHVIGLCMDKQILYQRLTAIKNKLYRVALTMLKNEEDAKDVVQDTYLKIWSHEMKFYEVDVPEAFAMKMLKNLCIDKLRIQKKSQTLSVESQYNMSDNITPFQSVSFENLKDLMLMLFNTLPDQQKLVIHLRDIEHYSYEEICEVTGLNVNNIRVILSRARQSVRANYQKIKNYENRGY